MGLEAADFIAGLDQSWPTGLDKLNKGDDHLRLIKKVMKDTLPGAGGEGFARAILATEDEIDNTVGSTSNIQAQITDNADAIALIQDSVDENAFGVVPIGGIVLYSGAFADIPGNWALCDGQGGTPDMDKRFARGTTAEGNLGNSGGSDDAVVVSHGHTTNSTGAHTHTVPVHDDNSNDGPNPRGVSDPEQISSKATSSAGSHSHTVNNTGVSGTGKNMPAYIELAYIRRMT